MLYIFEGKWSPEVSWIDSKQAYVLTHKFSDNIESTVLLPITYTLTVS